MIKTRLKEMELKITELSDYLQLSRPTMYKFIEAYDSGNYAIINERVLDVFKYIDSNSLIGKKAVIRYLISSLPTETTDEAQNGNVENVIQYLSSNPNSAKSRFITTLIENEDFDDVITYLIEIYPLLRKDNLSDDEINFLKPYDDIRNLINTYRRNEKWKDQ